MNTFVSGFDWNTGNRAKCQKHGVSVDEIEGLFARPIMILPDTAHSTAEERLRAIGRTRAGRYVFLVFTVRERHGEKFIRPKRRRHGELSLVVK